MESGNLQLNNFIPACSTVKPSREDIITEVVESVIKQNASYYANANNFLNPFSINYVNGTPTTSSVQQLFKTPLFSTFPVVKDQRKRKSWYYKFRPEYSVRFPGIQKSTKSDDFFYCITCGLDLSLGKKGHKAIERHVVSIRHLSFKDRPENQNALLQMAKYNDLIQEKNNINEKNSENKSQKIQIPQKNIFVKSEEMSNNSNDYILGVSNEENQHFNQPQFTPTNSSTTAKKKTYAYTNEFKLEVIEFCKQRTNHEAARKYDIDRKTIRRWRLAEEDIRNSIKDNGQNNQFVINEEILQQFDVDMERELVMWIQGELMISHRVTGDLIQKRAQEIFNHIHKGKKDSSFIASDVWLQHFSMRHNISYRQINIDQFPHDSNPTLAVSEYFQNPIKRENAHYPNIPLPTPTNQPGTAYDKAYPAKMSTTDMLKDLVDSAVCAMDTQNF